MTDLSPRDAAKGAQARALYAAGHPIRAIQDETGLRPTRIYFWLDHDVGPDGQPRPRPLPRRRPGRSLTPANAARRRLMLAQRIWRAAEAQVCEIETRLATLDPAPGAAERDARALAVLARVVRDMSALDGAPGKGGTCEVGAGEHDEAFGDLDTFRRELARRLDGLREEGSD